MSKDDGKKQEEKDVTKSSPFKAFLKKHRDSIKDFTEIIVFLGIAILLVFSFNWILGAILHTDTPLVVVTSESMEPTYYGSNRDNFGGELDIRKDMLIVKGVNPSEIRVGDVIVFYRINASNPSQLDYVREPIVHRVNRVYLDNITGEYWFTTKGDNPDTNDEYIRTGDIIELTIHESRLIGKIVGRIPYLGGIISYFKTSTGRIVLIVVIAAILLLTFVLGSFTGKGKDKDVFDDEPNATSNNNSSTIDDSEAKPSFKEKFKLFTNKLKKRKNIIIPSVILGIIIFIPIVDSLSAQWGTHFGVTDVDFDGGDTYTVEGGSMVFIFADITINSPGHWHQKFNGFSLQIYNITTGEIIGSINWTIVYNFEGSKTVSTGAWVNPADVVEGLDYNMTVTAHLQNKLGKTWSDIYSVIFTLTMRP
ncbi:MAG: signal peptidase I [Candidatus Heimdallarchaeota archaeon]|nr:signal peptidase I [Candidatus Heimdallarchaeota archaeon]